MSLTRKEAIRKLWERGNLDYKRHPNQLVIKNNIKKNPLDVIVILCARRFGKSFELVLESNELCQSKPGSIVKYICPKLKMVKTVIKPIMRDILKDCPIDMRPEWKENDKMYVYPNGSELHLAGTDNGSHESIRGGQADLCIVDEAGFCDHLDYVVNSVLAPTTDTTGGKVVLISTPSKTTDHEFIQNFVIPAKAAGTLTKFTIHDNPLLTERKKEGIAARYTAGKKDPHYLREYLCEIITDIEDLVVGEFQNKERQEKIVQEVQRPDFFDIYVGGDIGFKDLSAFIFGYYDFPNATLVIEDEVIMNKEDGITTEKLAEAILAKEKELYRDQKIYRRVMDNDYIMINDFQMLHGLQFMATGKDNKEAQINKLKMLINNDRLRINPRCKHLIYHMEHALWDKNRKSFKRMPDLKNSPVRGGHADTLDALIYLVRNLVKSSNPFPDNWDKYSGNSTFTSNSKKPESSLMGLVKNMMGIKKKD